MAVGKAVHARGFDEQVAVLGLRLHQRLEQRQRLFVLARIDRAARLIPRLGTRRERGQRRGNRHAERQQRAARSCAERAAQRLAAAPAHAFGPVRAVSQRTEARGARLNSQLNDSTVVTDRNIQYSSGYHTA